ncbi:MAG: ligase-associated DNA damage response DEXH box helicase [Bacteroidota bacterium]
MSKRSPGYTLLQNWLKQKNWKLAAFQREMIGVFAEGKSGLLNAPTGSGKTYGLWFPILIGHLDNQAKTKRNQKPATGLQVLWITPLRALARDLQRNMQEACDGLETGWRVGIRTGDMGTEERAKQKKQMPEALIITPESLHLLFSQKGHKDLLKNIHTVVVDEWHELMGSKRGVQTELALSGLRALNPKLQTWGISATIGNMEQAMDVLLGPAHHDAVIVRSSITKKIKVESILPDKIESLPWAGYLGVNLLDKVMAIVAKSKTTLLFTNTRSQTEIWYRYIMEKHPEMAGLVALHHGSLAKEIRDWVENALHEEKLKLVICTSSLDLGVDFRPVETVIQVGSPKSISRFVQRAGRSGHRPGEQSIIYFTPTHALELIEGVSLREGVERNILEERMPVVNAFDVLVQWMVTLAVGGGFRENELYEHIKKTHAYQFTERAEWEWLLTYITVGSRSLYAYDEFKKVEVEDGAFIVKNRRIAMKHRLSMGTIVSESSLRVKFVSGKYLGAVEEYFASRLNPGDVFWFAGMSVEFVHLRDMVVSVKKAEGKKGIVPQWMGGRMPLSSNLSVFIRENLAQAIENPHKEKEFKKLLPLLQLQNERSTIPKENELLIEQCETKEGHHIFVFPFEGRLVHEGIAALLAYRLSRLKPVTFSIAMNDYGFELLSDQYLDVKEILSTSNLFNTDDLVNDIYRSVNATEMAKRKFREIAAIAGLTFQGYPGSPVKVSHLQASSSLLFNVMFEYEKDNLFIRQAYQEVLDYQLEENRMRSALQRIATQHIIIKTTERPTPFAFPILVDRLREQLTSEKLEERIQKMIKPYKNED